MFTIPTAAKLLVLIGIGFFIWHFFFRKKKTLSSRSKSSPTDKKIQDMELCSQCGSYVSASSAQSCGKSECPY